MKQQKNYHAKVKINENTKQILQYKDMDWFGFMANQPLLVI